jgi:Arc/MetJ-type ribon-helix-helix transcriptional regulator
MTFPFPPDVQQSLTDWVASGKYASEADVMRDALRALTHEQDDLSAVQEALAELERGDKGIALQQAFDEIRQSHGLQRGT